MSTFVAPCWRTTSANKMMNDIVSRQWRAMWHGPNDCRMGRLILNVRHVLQLSLLLSSMTLTVCYVVTTSQHPPVTVCPCSSSANLPLDIFALICVYFVCFCFIMHSCCITVSMVGWTWWDWSLILRAYLSSVHWHCWLGHLTNKNPSPIWPIMSLVGR